ncbi:nitrogen permease regulator Npr2 [Coprinopsis sp. MPI-PUGE-AT-0042]|nr:nitrogen permease regulator Npr2 [Coprinopsis sp. MPI-PUGE-AT-0042]
MPSGDSFLPRIQSVFYAIFDEKVGPKIVYQVPEGLIASGQGSGGDESQSLPSSPSPESASDPPTPFNGELMSRSSSSSSTLLLSPADSTKRGRQLAPQRSTASLFNFADVSMYIIPHATLCGRLVTCSTSKCRIIGFPVELRGRYERHYFRYNLCFVFERTADLSAYEAVVRKISRVLKSCEEESGFLSSPETSSQVHSILEQLYEDLNSYAETSIPVDQFNSIELKIFPFYPNPPEVKDWMVPVALINLPKRFEDNWDLTMIKVCHHIDGVNHVRRIAHLAECDPQLTRKAISHLLYYQVIMTIDIFQYSNVYTLCKSVQWLADEIKEECLSYVVKPGTKEIPDWPDLLHLYSRLKIGKTVYEWMDEYNVEGMGIDVRRFITFGVIKAFLRRVRRYPYYIPPDTSQDILDNSYDPSNSTLMRKRAKSLQSIQLSGPLGLRLPGLTVPLTADGFASPHIQPPSALFNPNQQPLSALESGVNIPDSSQTAQFSATHRARRASAAEKVLENLRNREVQRTGAAHSPRTTWVHYQHKVEPPAPPPPQTANAVGDQANAGVPASSTTIQGSLTASYLSATAGSVATVRPTAPIHESPTKGTRGRRTSIISPTGPPPSPVLPKMTVTPSRTVRGARSPSMALGGQGRSALQAKIIPLLDGDHHADEICTTLGIGWPQLEKELVSIGGGQGDGDFGNVVLIYR